MKKLSLVYFGSPDFSARFLEKLLTNRDLLQLIEVKLVVTQPDRPFGRKQILTPTLVKQVALKQGLEILEIENLKLNKNLKLKIKNFDICLVYAYAAIIPKELLDKPKYGFWCTHPSLLPLYRGTSPMATALINGDRETGVTIIKMDEKIDHGPVIAQEKYHILPTDKRPDLEKKLTDLALEMFKKTIKKLLITDYELKTQEQNHNNATYTKKLTKQDGFIPFENLKIKNLELNKNLKLKIYNLYRGLYPWPGVWTILRNDKRLKITQLKIENGKLKIVRVQLEGKKEVDFETFENVYKVFKNQRG